MASVNISIKKEAYDFLNQFKKEGTSYSDIILRFRKKDDSIMRFFGKLKDTKWNEKEKNMKSFRDSFEERLK